MVDGQYIDGRPDFGGAVQAPEGTAAYHKAQVKDLLESLLGLDLDGWDDEPGEAGGQASDSWAHTSPATHLN
jgi:hypothetical protein